MNKRIIEEGFKEILSNGLGLDLTNPGLLETPERIARMFCEELFNSEDVKLTTFDNEGVFENKEEFDEIILFDAIPVSSMCEHHVLPFSGLAYFMYIPDKLIVGASKPARLFKKYSTRLQLQERIGKQVLKEFTDVVKPLGVMIVYHSVHACMSCRGIKQTTGGGMTISLTWGVFRDDSAARIEGLALVQIAQKERR